MLILSPFCRPSAVLWSVIPVSTREAWLSDRRVLKVVLPCNNLALQRRTPDQWACIVFRTNDLVSESCQFRQNFSFFLKDPRLLRNWFLQKLHYNRLHFVSKSVLSYLMQGPNQVCGYVSQWELDPYEAYLQQFVCCKWRAFQLLAFAVEDHFHLRRCCLWLVSHTRCFST